METNLAETRASLFPPKAKAATDLDIDVIAMTIDTNGVEDPVLARTEMNWKESLDA